MNSKKSQQHLLKQTSQRLKRLRKNKQLSQKSVAARCKWTLVVIQILKMESETSPCLPFKKY